MATYKQLLAEKEALEAKLNEVRATEVASVIDKIRELMTEYGLTAEDILPRRKRGRPAGTASKVANVAEIDASQRLFLKDCTKSECANTARNQRNENSVVGMASVLPGVKATTQTMTSGASMKVMTSALKSSARGPFLDMVRSLSQ